MIQKLRIEQTQMTAKLRSYFAGVQNIHSLKRQLSVDPVPEDNNNVQQNVNVVSSLKGLDIYTGKKTFPRKNELQTI